jgi:hypothetical protein
MDALYFRPGFTILLEWGHAKYYDNNEVLRSSEEFMINPFKGNLTKESIQIQLNTNTQKSAGNYGGMLGIVTNFNFSITEGGGYDCSITILALGSVLGNFPINHAAVLPDTYYEQLTQLITNKRIQDIALARKKADDDFNKEIQNAKDKLNSSKDGWGQYLVNNATELQSADLRKLNLTFNTKNINYIKDTDVSGNEQAINTVLIQPNELLDNYNVYLSKHIISGRVSSTNPNIKAYYFENRNDSSGVIYFDENSRETTNRYISGEKITGQGNNIIQVKLDLITINRVLRSSKPLNKFKIPTTSQNFVQSIFANTGDFLQYNYIDGTTTQEYGPYSIKIYSPNLVTQAGRDQAEKDIINPDTVWNIISVKSNVDGNQNSVTLDLKIELGAYSSLNSNKTGPYDYTLTLGGGFSLADLSFIKEIITNSNNQPLIINKTFEDYQNAISNAEAARQANFDNQTRDVDAKYNEEQLHSTIQGESTIELMLRSLLVYSINSPNKNSREKFNKYIKALFSEGAYKKFFQNGVPQKKKYTIEDLKAYVNGSMSSEKRLEMNMMYGNNFSLMSCEDVLDDAGEVKTDYIDKLPQVDFNKLFEIVLIKYGKTADIEIENKPDACVYINLGLFFLMLNHTGILYNKQTTDALNRDEVITPMAYLDFNPETNYYLSSENQFSINPYKFIVKFPSTAETYQKLFDEKLIPKGVITYKAKQYVDDKPEPVLVSMTEKLFNPKNDIVSKYLSDTKTGLEKTANGYIGKLMNVQVEISYLLSIMSEYRTSSDSHEVYFQSVIENIIFDLNKNMGNYNAYRLSYNDAANCYGITDDQLQSKPHSSLSSIKSDIIKKPEKFEIPIYGKTSIARSVTIATDMSSRLASYLAISSNPSTDTQVVTSKNTTDFGVYNTGSYDRYAIIKTDGTATPKENNVQNAQAAELAVNFNSVVSKIYTIKKTTSTPDDTPDSSAIIQNISDSDIDRALGYYIDRMAKVKNAQKDTAHAMIIPLTVNITMDGMSGIYPFQLFTINENILPYRYSSKALSNRKIAFTITAISNNFESNQWTTTLQGKMVLLKEDSKEQNQPLQQVEQLETPQSSVVVVNSADFTLTREQIIQKIVTKMRSLGYSNMVIAAFLGNFEIETNFDAKKIFTDSADPANNAPNIGLAQWQKTRKDQLLAQFDYNTIEGQIDFVHFELTKGKFISVLNELNTLSDREEAALKAGEIVAEKYEVASKDSKYSEAYFNRSEFALNFYKELIANKYP